MIKLLAFIGLVLILVIISSIIGAMLALLDDDVRKRERWSRTLEENEDE